MCKVYSEQLSLHKGQAQESKKEGLMGQLVQLVGNLWREKSGQELEALLNALQESHFRFSSMYHSWIPKPNKPGELRPITQLANKDIIVMDDISYLLNKVYAEIFLETSHGSRKGRGPITFFSNFHGWVQ